MSRADIRYFGTMADGRKVEEIILRSGLVSCSVITYGGALRTLTVPDKDMAPVDVALGFDKLSDYVEQDKYMGALIGRYANRIGAGRFRLGDTEYALAQNDGVNHLHGGSNGFDKKLWAIEAADENSVALTLESADGEENYPGNLSVQVKYALIGSGLFIDYRAKCDKDTLCSLTNHAYFNLSGHGSGPITDQYIQLFADQYTPTDASSIPTGEIASVEGTPMDLRKGVRIGDHIDDTFHQLALSGGYDHNWCIRKAAAPLAPAARAWSEKTGIMLEVCTTQHGIQFYSGNYMADCPAGKGGAAYDKRRGFCLETQSFPDSPNHPSFPSAVLAAGEEYHEQTAYLFSTISDDR